MNGSTPTFNELWKEAWEAGMKAGDDAKPTPMNVVGHGKTYHVPEGACGFAWVHLPYKGDNRKLVNWLKKAGFAKKAYPTGFMIWVSEFGQSIARKEAAARAMANVFRDHGFDAYAQSRMD